MNCIKHFILLHSVFKYPNRFPTVNGFNEAKNLVLQNRIKAEIIGQWVYCFTTPIIGVQLGAIGFWYSYKHEAWIYSGRPKDGIADDATPPNGGAKILPLGKRPEGTYDESIDEIRARLGSSHITA